MIIWLLLIILVIYLTIGINNSRNNSQSGGSNQLNGSNFVNFCLTQRPRGFYQSLCTWWKNLDQVDLSQQMTKVTSQTPDQSVSAINNDRKWSDIDLQYGSFPTQINGYGATEFISYDPDYYLDATTFCQNHPTHRLCPNHWVS